MRGFFQIRALPDLRVRDRKTIRRASGGQGHRPCTQCAKLWEDTSAAPSARQSQGAVQGRERQISFFGMIRVRKNLYFRRRSSENPRSAMADRALSASAQGLPFPLPQPSLARIAAYNPVAPSIAGWSPEVKPLVGAWGGEPQRSPPARRRPPVRSSLQHTH